MVRSASDLDGSEVVQAQPVHGSQAFVAIAMAERMKELSPFRMNSRRGAGSAPDKSAEEICAEGIAAAQLEHERAREQKLKRLPGGLLDPWATQQRAAGRKKSSAAKAAELAQQKREQRRMNKASAQASAHTGPDGIVGEAAKGRPRGRRGRFITPKRSRLYRKAYLPARHTARRTSPRPPKQRCVSSDGGLAVDGAETAAVVRGADACAGAEQKAHAVKRAGGGDTLPVAEGAAAAALLALCEM